ncbi:Protein of unknown function [Natronoarchaeum philippinense]|uniref:Archaeal Type IV pilin N-terminal domain-containing protein n=1 Tax=Natronoarchaeum philippinense TaxID=558529 RepID=A0A285P3V7_NATPI|nr:type IV pilin [Natronoarchaeum philippinense]SNZ16138.1 Protein of unknown function [Natronoarchaeum philippinense]
MTRRGVAPVVGVALLVFVSVALAAVVAGGLAAVDADGPPAQAALAVDVDTEADEITVSHGGGSTLDPEAVSVSITVNGSALAQQPPVPFFSANGFVSGPTGPFNPAWSGDWGAGESASLRIAGTNAPGGIDPGATVDVVVRVDGQILAERSVAAE